MGQYPLMSNYHLHSNKATNRGFHLRVVQFDLELIYLHKLLLLHSVHVRRYIYRYHFEHLSATSLA
jgi:hypothetical protein